MKSVKGSKKIKVEPSSCSSDTLACLKDLDSYFGKLIDLIPPKIYFQSNDEMKDKIEDRKRVICDFDDDGSLSKSAKHKRHKLDPSQQKTVTQLTDELDNNQNLKQKHSKVKRKSDSKLSELQQKLNEKIAAMKSGRGGETKKKHQRESKKERQKHNRHLPGAKQKGYIKTQLAQNSTDNETTNGEVESSKVDKIAKVYNNEGNIVFSKFDFVSSNLENEPTRKKQKRKDLKKLLVEAKKEEEKMKNLEEEKPEIAEHVKSRKLWRSALNRSEGVKVKDKVQLLSKAIKKRDQQKKKSTKKWQDRNQQVESRMQARQEKRKRNLQARKDQKKEKNLAKARKKGRAVPGF